jgi:FKBP12-rapamycin complex-associated protein
VLRALEVFANNLSDYLHLVIPAVVRLFDQVDAPANVRIRYSKEGKRRGKK